MTGDTRNMKTRSMKAWRPHLDLEQLSAALAQEIVTMPDGELRRVLAEIGYPIEATAQEVREVIAAASGEGDPAAPKRAGLDGQRRIFVAP
jgi:hypothetical protein